MAIVLVPIILIESAVGRVYVQLPATKLVSGIAVANVVSTFIGIPIASVVMLLVNILTTGTTVHGFDTPIAAFKSVVLQASWLVPYEDQLDWLVPAATLVLLVPYFLASVWIERITLYRAWKTEERRRVARVALVANIVSYTGLAAVVVIWLWRAITAHESG